MTTTNAQPDIFTMTRRQLLDYQQELLADRDAIQSQLDYAKSTRAATGQYADAAWFRSAQAALRHKKRSLQAVSVALGKYRRGRNDQVERLFVDVARQRLQETIFYEILAEAQELSRIQRDGDGDEDENENDYA